MKHSEYVLFWDVIVVFLGVIGHNISGGGSCFLGWLCKPLPDSFHLEKVAS